MFKTLLAWLNTAFAALSAIVQTKTVVANAPDPLVAYIAANNYAIGPMPTTGGVIHKDTAAVVAQVAADIRKCASGDMTVPLITAWIEIESRYDPAAIDPNDQDAKPGETAAQAAQHADIGIAQFDMATLEAMPEFVGRSVAQIEATVESADWGVREFVTFAQSLITGARGTLAARPSLVEMLPPVPGAKPEFVLGIQAYNSGPTGAANMAKLGGSFAYAKKVLAVMATVQAAGIK